MLALITGGAGFIGSQVAGRLDRGGHEVHVVARPGTAAHRLAKIRRGDVHRVDLTDLRGVTDVAADLRPDFVIHAASSPGHPNTPAQRRAAWRDDVTATVTLLEALRQHPPERFILVGSSLVYRPSLGPLSEDAALGPETERGVIKLAVEKVVRRWSNDTGVPAVVVRAFSVYGPGEQQDRVIPTLLRALRDGAPFALTADESSRDFVHVADVARVVELVASSSGADGRALNIGTEVETSIKQLVATAESVTGRAVAFANQSHPPTPPQRPHWCADPTLAARLVGWRSEIDLERGLAALWETMA